MPGHSADHAPRACCRARGQRDIPLPWACSHWPAALFLARLRTAQLLTSGAPRHASSEPREQLRPPDSKRPLRLGVIFIVFATITAYRPAINGGFIWDDDDYVTNNDLLHSGAGLVRLWEPGHTHQYYPVVFTTFWAEYHLWRLDPLGYHVVNVLLHVANALLLWRIMSVLGIPGAWMIGAVFALHPMNVESVAWITERKNVLSGFFYLLATLTYLRFDPMRDKEAAAEARRPAWAVLRVVTSAVRPGPAQQVGHVLAAGRVDSRDDPTPTEARGRASPAPGADVHHRRWPPLCTRPASSGTPSAPGVPPSTSASSSAA